MHRARVEGGAAEQGSHLNAQTAWMLNHGRTILAASVAQPCRWLDAVVPPTPHRTSSSRPPMPVLESGCDVAEGTLRTSVTRDIKSKLPTSSGPHGTAEPQGLWRTG